MQARRQVSARNMLGHPGPGGPKAFLRGMVQQPYHEDGSGPQDDMQQKETNPYHPWDEDVYLPTWYG